MLPQLQINDAEPETAQAPENRRYRFGPFVLDTATGELERDGETVQLPPQAAQVLGLLVTRAGELVTRDELRRELWPGDVHVEADLGINHLVRKVRQALGDDAASPTYVETLPRRGYRFRAPVEPTDDPPSWSSGTIDRAALPRRRPWLRWAIAAAALLVVGAASAWWISRSERSPPVGSEPTRLAVFPLAAEDELRPLADGLGEEIAATLTHQLGRDIDVLAFSSSRHLDGRGSRADAARELRADYVVSGEIAAQGDGLSATFRLRETESERVLWSDSYAISRQRLPELRSGIARQIAQALGRRAVPEEAPVAPQPLPPELYESYLQALTLLQRVPTNDVDDRDDRSALIQRATGLLEEIVARAPENAAAWEALARARNWSQLWRPLDAYGPVTEAAAQRAVALDPSRGAAWATLATLTLALHYDWPAADRYSQLAVRASPGIAATHSARAEVLATAGRSEEARREIAVARRLDPLDWEIAFEELYYDYLARHWEAAIQRGTVLRKAHPEDPVLVSIMLRAYAMAGDEAAAVRLLRERREELGLEALPDYETVADHWQQEHDYLESAAQFRRGAAYWHAIPLIGLGRGEEAAELLRDEACTPGGSHLTLIHVEPFFQRLAGLPAYEEAVRCVGMPRPPAPS